MTDVSRLLTPEEFAAAMTDRWHSLGNTSSPRLRKLWATMAVTFARAVADTHNTKWRVLEPPTGTGKTQGLCVYVALTIAKNQTSPSPLGILVVTRTIAQAEEIIVTIREMLSDPADATRVRTKHSEAKLNAFEMHAADVLVITHAAYTRALEGCGRPIPPSLSRGSRITDGSSNLPGVATRMCGRRCNGGSSPSR